jgi:hypothetical protein
VLQSAGIGGAVRIRFTIDTIGRVTRPYEFLVSDHELLSASVRAAMPRWRYSPGIRAGRPVLVVQEEVFEFLNDGKDLSPLPPSVLRRDTTPDGVARTVIGHAFRDSAGAASVTAVEEHAAQRAAISTILTDRPRAPGADIVLCVWFAGGNHDPAREQVVADRLVTPGIRVVGSRDCPPTYQSMIARLDSLGRRIHAPPGWVDPHHLATLGSRPWSRDLVIVEAKISQGTGAALHHCVVERREAAWVARCEVRSVSVS